jgi:hypothetical protein
MDSFVNKDADLNSAKAEALANASRSVAGYLQVCILPLNCSLHGLFN